MIRLSVDPRLWGTCWEGVPGCGDGRVLLLEAVVSGLHPRVRGAYRSDVRGMATAKLKLPWSVGSHGGRSSTEDGRGVAVTGAPEVLVAGTVVGASLETPETLVAGTAEVPTTGTGIP